MTTRLDDWFYRPQPVPHPHKRLFCFPYAGGGASFFRAWPGGLPPGIELLALQLPGRESRFLEPPLTRISALVKAFLPAILPYLDVPFSFFGHSMGSTVAFELTRHLRERSASLPEHLFVSGHHAPQIPYPHPPIHNLPETTFLEEIRRFEGTPEEVLQHKELMQLLIPVLRADFEMTETYQYIPGSPLTCPITVFGGREDHQVPIDNLEAWREQTMAGFALHMFPGGHFYLQDRESQLLQLITRI
ncbi:MAG: thioesterase II family protein [Anaerolineales bacterium]